MISGISTVVNAITPCALLHQAIREGDFDLVKQLLVEKVDPMCEHAIQGARRRSAIELAKALYVIALNPQNRNNEKIEKAALILQALEEKL
jgi:hypothetical protein